jgi:hypothetical protein
VLSMGEPGLRNKRAGAPLSARPLLWSYAVRPAVSCASARRYLNVGVVPGVKNVDWWMPSVRCIRGQGI